jgi:transposase, IS5 family
VDRGYISGQKRGVTEAIKRDLRRRCAVEPCIGHFKSEHRMTIDHLAHAGGDANAVLAAAGNNFRRLLAWLTIFLRLWIAAIKGGEPSRNLARLA